MTADYFKIALENLRSRSLRSWLTILGIVIGIFLVITLLSLSEGLKQSVMSELQMMGGDMVIVFPGDASDMMTTMMGGAELKAQDIDSIKRAEGVETVLEMPFSAITVRHLGRAETSLIFGVDFNEGLPVLRDDMGWSTTRGEFPRAGRREVLVGNLVPQNVFPDLVPGDTVRMGGKEFTVTGVLRSLGNREDDMSIMLDLQDYREVTGEREGSPMALAKIKEGYDPDTVASNIERELEETAIRRRDEDSPSFTAMTSETVTDMVENIMGVLQAGVVAFASIAIVVGGIGIMNTMYTSVKERTKEIGILKAVGARRGQISSIFLFEAGIIGLIGGVGGVALGVGLALLAQAILASPQAMIQLEAHISVWLILFGLGFSFAVGCLSGYFPAKQAAKLEPVDALRYE